MRNRKLWKLIEVLFLLAFAAFLAAIFRRYSQTWRRDAEQKAATEAMTRLSAEATAGASESAAPDDTAVPEPEPSPENEETPTPEPSEDPTPEPTEDPEPDATEFSQVAEGPVETPAPTAKRKPGETDTPKPTAAPRNTPNADMLLEAQEKLKENSDYVGMVGFGNMAMYVCQSKNNSYYAKRRFDKRKDKGGMIYMDWRCDSWPLSDNTVLYGHNMRDGTRFGQLQHFLDPNYLTEHPYVTFASLYNVQKYAPVSIMRLSIDPKHEDYLEYDRINFDSETDFNVYMEGIRARSLIRLDDVEVKYGDHLLTLSTCSEDYDGGRLVVVCVEVDD